MQISVIGCGRWGSFIAWYLRRTGHGVTLYGRPDSANMKRFMDSRENDYLTLQDDIVLSTDLSCCDEAEVIVISIGSQSLDGLCKTIAGRDVKNKTFVLCMKGMDIPSGRSLSLVAKDALDKSCSIAVWLGPGHVQEFYRGVPNCMVIDSDNKKTVSRLVDAFSSDLIRFYYGTDLIGNEIGAAAKNVIGIAAGMLDGYDLSSLKGALMSRGTREISRLIEAMGGNALSAYGLCHLGDYEATVFSPYSQNRLFGEKWVKGEQYGKLAEGYYTVKAFNSIAQKLGVELPICAAVYATLYEKKEPLSALNSLFTRTIKNEF